MESYYNARTKKYGLVTLKNRHKDIQMPEIILADLKQAYRKKQMKSHFTPQLISSVDEALKNNEQIILFQNRRGYSPYISCSECGWIPSCKHCDVSLTYHKYANNLSCHYCGYSINLPKECPSCKNTDIKTKGFGTEKIEDDISFYFPEAKVARMDLDTTRSRKKYEKIISDFEMSKVDILIGTQMVTKGLDFGNVTVVGVLNADNILNFPDFRSFERAYQLMTQVSGRAGRKEKQGKVILQTSDIKHPVIKNIVENDYLSMYISQMEERRLFKYPPFYKLIKLTIRHKSPVTLTLAADNLAYKLKSIFGNRILGPESPDINKIQNWFIKNIMIKIEKDKPIQKAKDLIYDSIQELSKHQDYKSIQVAADVDNM